MYQYRSKYFPEIIVTAVRYHAFNLAQEKELTELFNDFPYSYEDIFVPGQKTIRQVSFYDDVNMKEIKVSNGEWIIRFDKDTFSTLDHWDFRERFEFYSPLSS